MAEQSDWTDEFPKEEGWYWFVGKQFRGSTPSIHVIRVFIAGRVTTQQSIVAVCDGAFMYEGEKGEGWFKPIAEQPTEQLMNQLLSGFAEGQQPDQTS